MTVRKPAESNTFDLDALEREDRADAFTANIGGMLIGFTDPQELDWQDLVASQSGNPLDFIKAIVDASDRDAFLSVKLPAWKLNKLVEAYTNHYGMPSQGE